MIDKFYTYCKQVSIRESDRVYDKDGESDNIRFNTIFHRFVDSKGNCKCQKTTHVRKEFVESPNRQTPYKNIYNIPLVPYNKNNELHREADRYGFTSNDSDFISETYTDEIHFDVSKILFFTIDIEVEQDEYGFPSPKEARTPINVLTIHVSLDNTYHVFCFKDFTQKIVEGVSIVKHIFEDEYQMLLGVLDFFAAYKPDVLTGWFSNNFDIPYLLNRIRRVGVKDEKFKSALYKLSPFNIVRCNSGFTEFEIVGVSTIDFVDVFKKLTFGERSYALNAVASDYLGVEKLENPYKNFKDFYEKDWDLFVSYNIRDVELVVRLMEKTNYFSIVFGLAYLTKSNYDNVFGTLKVWENYICNELKKDNVFVKQKKYNVLKDDRSIVGGYVKEPVVGLHKWLVSFDANSLYPSIIRTFNLSPETQYIPNADTPLDLLSIANHKVAFSDESLKVLLDKHSKILKKYNLTLTSNGQLFKQDKQGLFPRLCEHVYNQRVETKNEMKRLKKYNYENGIKDTKKIDMLDVKQHAYKILLNSLYGAQANKYFMFYNPDIAEAITTTGQFFIQCIGEQVGDKLDALSGTKGSLVYVDTDSNYLTLTNIFKKLNLEKEDTKTLIEYAHNFSNDIIQKYIKQTLKQFHTAFNVFNPNVLEMKREKICESGFWIAKKRYALRVWDDEGLRLTESKYAVTGLENKRSSTSSFAKQHLNKLIEALLSGNKEKAVECYKNAETEFYNYVKQGKLQEIALPIGVNNIPTSQTIEKGLPQHVKGAIIFNNYIRQNGWAMRYKEITSGDKVFKLFLDGNVPFCIPQNVEDEDIYQHLPFPLDSSKLFNISFGEAASRMFMACGVDLNLLNNVSTLDSFFG